MVCVRYRLRQPRASPIWQILHDYAAKLPGLSADTAAAIDEYLLRAPFSLEKITYNAESGSVLCRSERHWRTKRNFEVSSTPQFIAALLDQIPRKGAPQVRYYGRYSPYPHPRDEPIRFRAEVMEPGEDFDQTGFELPAAPQVAPADSGQGELFGDDYSQPDSADREPVFWSASGGQDFPADDCVQPDAPD
jgi:hypothetical protein